MPRAVQHTADLDRILALPVRTDDSSDLVDALSARLTRPHTCTPECAGGIRRLHPLQAQALVEAHDRGGLFLQAPIGSGKTLVSILLPALFNAKRPLLVVPGGSIMTQTVATIKQCKEHWDVRPITLQSYQYLQQEEHANYLLEYDPDLVVFDEAHRLKDPRRSMARRLRRFHKARPHVPLTFMSGTPAKRAIEDFAPALHYALREGTPMPVHDLTDWGLVLNAGVPEQQRIAPGALSIFGTDLQSIRRGVRDRIFSTPGAITSNEANVTAKLEITLRNVPLTPEEDHCFKALYEDMETPDGHQFFDAVELWRHARELALGFFNRWDPRPPEDWTSARKDWYASCREILSYSRKLDTEAQVATFLDNHQSRLEYEVLQRWRAIKDTFVPNSVPVWTGDTALQYAAGWLEGGGVCWTEHVPFGRKLAAMTGVPYFGEGGLTDTGESIVPYRGKALIASFQANGTGLNLQHYHRGLITSIWPTATAYDQTIGRQHRQGQKADIVTFDIPISCREQLAGFQRAAEEDAAFHADLLGVPSRLIGQPKHAERITQRGYAWKALKRA